MFRLRWCTEPEYEFEKQLNDADAYEKETAEFECEVNDEEAPVQWFCEDKVTCLFHCFLTCLFTRFHLLFIVSN